MELTNEHLEAIREAAMTIEYGSVTVHISATSKHLDLEVKKRIRIESEEWQEKKSGPSSENSIEGDHEPDFALHTRIFLCVFFMRYRYQLAHYALLSTGRLSRKY